MSAEYSTETIRLARAYASVGYPPGFVASKLGWDIARLKRFADKHEIQFKGVQAKSRSPDPARANIRFDKNTSKAWHGSRSVYLPPCEGRLFNAILKTGEYDWTVEKIAAVAEVPKRNVPAHISQLRSNLGTIGLTLSKRFYEIRRV